MDTKYQECHFLVDRKIDSAVFTRQRNKCNSKMMEMLTLIDTICQKRIFMSALGLNLLTRNWVLIIRWFGVRIPVGPLLLAPCLLSVVSGSRSTKRTEQGLKYSQNIWKIVWTTLVYTIPPPFSGIALSGFRWVKKYIRLKKWIRLRYLLNRIAI